LSRRASEAFAAGRAAPAPADASGIPPLIAAAGAVIAAFRGELEGGTLRPAQHATLLLLETVIEPFADLPGVRRAHGGEVHGRTPGRSLAKHAAEGAGHGGPSAGRASRPSGTVQ